jgi:hypothetical protein
MGTFAIGIRYQRAGEGQQTKNTNWMLSHTNPQVVIVFSGSKE